MLKYIGCALLIICSALWGYEKSRILKKTLQYVESLAGFIKRIGDQIDTVCEPLNLIYANYYNAFLEECGFLSLLQTQGLNSALLSLKPFVSSEIFDVLNSFSLRIGGGDKKAEIALCSSTYRILCDNADKLKSEIPQKEKLYKTVPVLCAVSIIIIII